MAVESPSASAPVVRAMNPSLEALANGKVQAGSVHSYWAVPVTELMADLAARPRGLSSAEAKARLGRHGPNAIEDHERLSRLHVIAAQLRNPLLLLLVFAALASALTGEWIDASIVLTIVIVSVAVGYAREYRAQKAAAALRARLRTVCQVLRDDVLQGVAIENIVPGDVVQLRAGSLVPADGVLIEATDCYVSQAALTGESFPVLKRPGATAEHATLTERDNCVFLGTNVRSGTALCLVARTGRATQFGAIAHRLTLRAPETEFDRGIRRFGYLLTVAMLVMVLVIFAAHMLRGRPAVETLLFSIALAVGLSPELLPAILSVSLSRGASAMARRGVLVRRLNAIENLGSMDVLCTDKTGTLTEGVVRMTGAYDAHGNASDHVLSLARTNAQLEGGLKSPLDDAILGDAPLPAPVTKLAEVPFDFVRKRVSVVVQREAGVQLIAKGAYAQMLEACSTLPSGAPLDEAARADIDARFRDFAARGIRVLAVATRTLEARSDFSRDDEQALCFEGFVTFLDRPKQGVQEALLGLSRLGVSVKVITGDARLVTEHVANLVGLPTTRVLSGRDLDELHDEALWRLAEHVDLFVEVDPNQKERIILALKKSGHVVGFMGDGVNDAPAMHAADTSVSVESAVDVAREAADFVLLEKDLAVVQRGIEEGRKTFANTLKYVLTTTSANLGNMVSMAIASLFLPFLPLLAGQILLNNFLSDIPAVGIADDGVDAEQVARPRRWSMRFIGRFMVEFGLLSSLFDFITFATLLFWFRAGPEEFRSGWFVESLLTELVIALVVRTRRPFFRSKPGSILLWSSISLAVLALAIPYLPGMALFGICPLPGALLLTMVAITMLYVLAAEITKHWFYRWHPQR